MCTKDSDCHVINGVTLSDSMKKVTCCMATTLALKGTSAAELDTITTNGKVLGYPITALDTSKTCF